MARRSWGGRSFGAALLSLLVLGAGTARTELWDRDEPRNAGCAREMLDRGDLVVPTFNGRLRTDKPVMLYWLMMGAYAVLGVHEASARLPSVLMSAGTCLLTWHLGRRLAGPHVGAAAAAILATTLMFNVAAHAATPDATLIFFTTAALVVFMHLTENGARPAGFPRIGPAVGLYGLMGLAVLAKGPVGFVLPCAVIGAYWIWQSLPDESSVRSTSGLMRGGYAVLRWLHPGRFMKTLWRMRPITLALTVLAVAGPWYLLVGMRTDGEWLRGFFIDHNVRRVTSSLEGHSGSWLWYYPAALLVGFFPWSIWALPTILDAARRLRSRDVRDATGFLIMWVVVVVGLFSVARTKLPSYITPAYPAVAILVAWSLVASTRAAATDRRWRYLADGVLFAVGAAVAIGLWLGTSQVLPAARHLALVGLIPAGTALAGWRLADRADRWLAGHWVGAFLLLLAVFGYVAPEASRMRPYRDLARLIETAPELPVATVGCLEPSWVFYTGRPWWELRGPTRDGSARRLGGWQTKERRSAASGLSSTPHGLPLDVYLERQRASWLIVTEPVWARLRRERAPVEVVWQFHVFLKPDEKLWVLRWRADAPAGMETAVAERETEREMPTGKAGRR